MIRAPVVTLLPDRYDLDNDPHQLVNLYDQVGGARPRAALDWGLVSKQAYHWPPSAPTTPTTAQANASLKQELAALVAAEFACTGASCQ